MLKLERKISRLTIEDNERGELNNELWSEIIKNDYGNGRKRWKYEWKKVEKKTLNAGMGTK